MIAEAETEGRNDASRPITPDGLERRLRRGARDPEGAGDTTARVDRVLLIDGLHTGYAGGKPGTGPAQASELETENLQIFLQFARDAVAGRKQMIVTHSEIFPGTFASTTETTDWLLRAARPHAHARGPLGTDGNPAAERGAGGAACPWSASPATRRPITSISCTRSPDYLKWLK